MFRPIFIFLFMLIFEANASGVKGVFLTGETANVVELQNNKLVQTFSIKKLLKRGRVEKLLPIDGSHYLAQIISSNGSGQIYLVNFKSNLTKKLFDGLGLNVLDENFIYFISEGRPCLYELNTEQVIYVDILKTAFSSSGYMQPLSAKLFNSDLYLSLGYPYGIGVFSNVKGTYKKNKVIKGLEFIDVDSQGVLVKNELGEYYFLNGDEKVALNLGDVSSIRLIKILDDEIFGTMTEFSLWQLSEVRKVISFNIRTGSLSKSFNVRKYGVFLNFI
ncbi:hypothetical protein [Pseudoalteromonas sp. McH1-42]|uniref:hypothetical protein n=1 Tax=Pseudoalteromonas sp. McH1-42 TaxID=2917752 RepID=UPI001EF4C1C5|nr:hypothetical protein [Pseudoalteromonas sp. McH1-42]MCG7564433.1 hypothetical protein [Pseudoalteromonas sp. McH1-42]